MDDNCGAICVVAYDVGVYVGVEEVRKIRCMWYVGLVLYVIEYDCLKLRGCFLQYYGP